MSTRMKEKRRRGEKIAIKTVRQKIGSVTINYTKMRLVKQGARAWSAMWSLLRRRNGGSTN